MGTYYNQIATENSKLLGEGNAKFIAVRNAGTYRQHKAKFYSIDNVPDYIFNEFEEFDGENWVDFFDQIEPCPAAGNYYFQLYSEISLKKHFETLFEDWEGFNDFDEKVEYVKDINNFDDFYDSEVREIAEVL